MIGQEFFKKPIYWKSLLALASAMTFFGVPFVLAKDQFPPHSAKKDISLQADYRLSQSFLKTDLVSELDSQQENPHLQKWVVSRNVTWVKLKAVPIKEGRFGVQAQGIHSQSVGWIRDQGPWYSPLQNFSCEKIPDAWFGTSEGSQVAAARAADLWSEILRNEKITLELVIHRISADTEEGALAQANTLLKTWLAGVETLWRRKAFVEARRSEWNEYLKTIQCLHSPRTSSQRSAEKMKLISSREVPAARDLMEPIEGDPPPISQLLTRAPVRLWNGLYTVRVSVTFAGRALNGRFLVDSEVPKSVVSPSWMEGQGIYPALVMVPGVPAEKVNTGIFQDFGGGLARIVRADKVEMSGLILPIQKFLLWETAFFAPPENAGECCDGVLGRDFLRSYPVEFDTHHPPEIRVWPKKNFHQSKDTPWIEVHESSQGGVVSGCTVSPAGSRSNREALPGVVWSTSTEDAMLVHTPWQKQVKKVSPNQWTIRCDDYRVADKVESTFPEVSPEDRGETSYFLKVPATHVGMPVLLRGNFTFDLPHGRLWLSKQLLEAGPPRMNETGVTLQYVLKNGERVLKVVSLNARSSAQSLIQAGLKIGSVITQVDGKSAEEMDLWEVERRLAGNYGQTVILQWKTKDGLRMAPLKTI